MEFFKQKAIENNWDDKKQIDVLLKYIENIFFEDFLTNLNTSSKDRNSFYQLANEHNLSLSIQKKILTDYLQEHIFEDDSFVPFSEYLNNRELELAEIA